MPRHVFHKTVQLAHRWSGPAALQAGLVDGVSSLDGLLELAQKRAADLAPLGLIGKTLVVKKSVYMEKMRQSTSCTGLLTCFETRNFTVIKNCGVLKLGVI